MIDFLPLVETHALAAAFHRLQIGFSVNIQTKDRENEIRNNIERTQKKNKKKVLLYTILRFNIENYSVRETKQRDQIFLSFVAHAYAHSANGFIHLHHVDI